MRPDQSAVYVELKCPVQLGRSPGPDGGKTRQRASSGAKGIFHEREIPSFAHPGPEASTGAENKTEQRASNSQTSLHDKPRAQVVRPDGSRWPNSATNLLASASLSILGSGCAPLSSSKVTSFWSLPNASCARLAITSGTFFLRRFASAFSLTLLVSAAKPIQYGGFWRAATAARMSTVGLSATVSGASFFFSFIAWVSAGV